MHQTHSYENQFTPWIPNTSVCDTIINADNLALALEYYALNEDFGRFEHINDVLFSGLYANGICRILISKSQRAYKNEH